MLQKVFRLYTDVGMRMAVWREAVLERIEVVLGNHEMSNRMLDISMMAM